MDSKSTKELDLNDMDKVSGGTNQIETTISSPVPGSTSENGGHGTDERQERRRYD